MERLTEFQGEPVTFIESMNVVEGVVCDVYVFTNDDSKDLGIVTVQPGCKTPLQKVLAGDKTIEGYLSGEAELHITREGQPKEYVYPGDSIEVEVMIEDVMRWHATGDEPLIFYEICYPPYQDGRYENLT